MIVSIAAVTSIDGRLTRHDETDITVWTSAEDKQHFHSLITDSEAIIMGRGTYEVLEDSSGLSDNRKLRIILTTHPEKFSQQNQPGQLEFTNETPQQIITRLQSDGIEKVLIAGGTKTIGTFLQAGVVTQLYLTLEPRIFGDGKPIVDLPLDIQLKLVNQRQLNQNGTLLLTYEVG